MKRIVASVGVLLAAAAAGFLIPRPTWLTGDGDADAGRSGSRPTGIEAPEKAGGRPRDATLVAGAGGPPPAPIDGLPPPVDFARVDRDTDLFGTVVDGAGAPVAGAVILTVTYPFDRADILAIERGNDAVEGPRTRSAKDGTFAIRLRRGATVALRVTAAGFAPMERRSSRAGERVQIVMRTGVSLVVEAATPEGLPAAKVEFVFDRRGQAGSAAFHRTAVTGPDGRARFDDLPAGVSGSLEVKASPWAWEEYDRQVRLPDSGEVAERVALTLGRTITGRVIDAETKAPVAGASVGMGWWVGRPVASDADGRYLLPGWTGQGIQEIHVRAEGYGRAQATVGTAEVVDFALSKGDTAVGRVVGPDGKAVAGAVVAAIGSVFRDREQTTSRADGTTSPDGRFALGGLRRDMPHTLAVMPAGFGRTLVDFDPRAEGPGTIDLGDVVVPIGRTLSGKILRHDGAPVGEARLQLKGANGDRGRLRHGADPVGEYGYGDTEEAATTDDGRFAFGDLAPGTYEIEAWTPGMSSAHATVRVGVDADPAPVEIRFPVGRSIHVTVVDDDGAPVPWAYLFVEGGSGPHNTVTPLDERGSASLLVPESVQTITVETWGGGGTDPRRFLESGHDFPLDPKASELRCVLKKGVSLAGRVVGPDGKAVAGAGLQIRRKGEVVASATTDDAGHFDVTVSREGPYTVRMDGSLEFSQKTSDSGLIGVALDVPAGSTDVVLRARPATRDRRQTVRVVDPDGRPLQGARVVAVWARLAGTSAEVVTDADGRAELVGLSDVPCSWKATPASDAGDLVPTYGDESVPSEGVVEIRMRRGVRARGHVVVPASLGGESVFLELTQGDQRRTTSTLQAGETVFSMLLDPEQGATGSIAARVGPDTAPTHVARIDNVRFGEGEIVLTLTPVK